MKKKTESQGVIGDFLRFLLGEHYFVVLDEFKETAPDIVDFQFRRFKRHMSRFDVSKLEKV